MGMVRLVPPMIFNPDDRLGSYESGWSLQHLTIVMRRMVVVFPVGRPSTVIASFRPMRPIGIRYVPLAPLYQTPGVPSYRIPPHLLRLYSLVEHPQFRFRFIEVV